MCEYDLTFIFSVQKKNMKNDDRKSSENKYGFMQETKCELL